MAGSITILRCILRVFVLYEFIIRCKNENHNVQKNKKEFTSLCVQTKTKYEKQSENQ